MKNKKTLSVIMSVLMLILTCSSPFISFASFFVSDGDVISCPGNTRAYVSSEEYNYAWLDSVIVRDGSSAVTPLTLHPVSDYPYSHTCEEFVEDCNNYVMLFDASEDAVQKSIIDSLKTVYYTLVATGVITDSNQEMRAFNESNGIVYPFTESKFTDLYTAITYVCLDKNLYKLVTDEDITITRGTTIEGAVVRFLSAVCGMSVPSSVESISSFSYLFTEEFVVDSGYPVSENPSEAEISYWVKLQAAQKAGYSVPATTKYADLSSEQIDYVTYAYDASILTTRYEAPIDPMKLKAALNSSDPDKNVPVLVLKSMLDHVSMSYNPNESIDNLFMMAAKEGYFELDEEFFTDIYNYDLYVSPDCEKVWITCFPVAEQLENGSNDNVRTYVNGALVKNNSTNPVDIAKDGATFTVRTEYIGSDNEATYIFNVIKSADAEAMNSAPSIDLSKPLEDLGADISNIIGNAVNNTEPSTSSNEGYTFENQLTTYYIGENDNATSNSMFDTTYSVDENGEVLTTKNPLELNATEPETSTSVLSGMAEAVKDNPVVVAAPAGLIAVGASAGVLFYRRRKDDINTEE